MKQFIKETWIYLLLIIVPTMIMFVPDIILDNITWATVTAWFSALTIGSVFGTILSIIVTILALLLFVVIFCLFISIVLSPLTLILSKKE